MKLERKLRRKHAQELKDGAKPAPIRYSEAEVQRYCIEAKNRGIEQGIFKSMAVFAGILLNDFGKISKKDGRIANFAKLFQDRLLNIEKPPSTEQLKAEHELYKCTQLHIDRSYK